MANVDLRDFTYKYLLYIYLVNDVALPTAYLLHVVRGCL